MNESQKESHCTAILAAFLIALFASSPASAQAQSRSIDPARLGRAEMNISCADAAKAPFERGLLLLHSFAWPEARNGFEEAAQADPNCAMAFWGIAMSYYDSLHEHPSAEEVEQARAALAKAHTASTAADRERAYLAAAENFFRGYPQAERRDRDRAYHQAMAELHRDFPEDREATIFYALSKLALARRGVENGNELQAEAAQIMEPLFREMPQHPGLAHYLIHDYDDAGQRDLGRAAALRYSGIAPSLTHAQHMPSHIFAGVGMWDENIASNSAALAAQPASYHAMMYLVYGHLQKGQRAKAREIVALLRAKATSADGNRAQRRGLHSLSTWLLLESRDWAAAAQAEEYSDVPLDREENLYVRGVGAARSGNLELAGRVLALLRNAVAEFGRNNDSGVAARYQMSQIHLQQVEAAVRLAEGRGDDAVVLMREAVQLADAPGVSWAPPDAGTGLPAHEFFGEILMELGRYDQALQEFQKAVERTPNRLYSVYGLAKSAALAGDRATAEAQFKALSVLLAEADPGLPEAAEVKQYLTRYETARAAQ
jgi:tetratricopeptide (TPR) repeat protein